MCGPCAQSPWRSFLHDERNQNALSHELPKGRGRTRERHDRFAISSCTCQLINFSSKVLASRFFQMAQQMEKPHSAQEVLQDSSSALAVIGFGHPDVLLPNLLAVGPVNRFARSQDGEIGIVPAQPPSGMSSKSGSVVPGFARTFMPTPNRAGVRGFFFGEIGFFFFLLMVAAPVSFLVHVVFFETYPSPFVRLNYPSFAGIIRYHGPGDEGLGAGRAGRRRGR